MCWISNSFPIKQEAQEDIEVIKIVNIRPNGLYSKYFNFKYNIEEHYTIESPIIVTETKEHFFIINEGFHSYLKDYHKTRIEHNSLGYSYLAVDLLDINTGTIKSNKDIFIKYKNEAVAVLECIIPKGTFYYINKNADIVSESIIPIKILKTYGREQKEWDS